MFEALLALLIGPQVFGASNFMDKLRHSGFARTRIAHHQEQNWPIHLVVDTLVGQVLIVEVMLDLSHVGGDVSQ